MSLNNEIQTYYGILTEDTCSNCAQSNTYQFYKTTKYVKFLFFSLFAKQKKFFKKCTNCLDVREIDEREAASIVAYNYQKEDKRAARKQVVRTVLPFLIVAAIAVGIAGLTLIGDESAIKRAVAGMPDGVYYVYNDDGRYRATLSIVDSVATYDMFAKYNTIDADEYDNLKEDLYEINYYYEKNGKLTMCVDTDSSVLLDKNRVIIQYSFFDPDLDEEFYYWGTKYPGNIKYIDESNAIYYIEYYVEEDKADYYKMRYKRTNDYWAEIYYYRDERGKYVLDYIDIYYVTGYYISGYAYYYLGDMNKDILAGLNDLWASRDILMALAYEGITPLVMSEYSIFEDTGIVQSWHTEDFSDDATVSTSATHHIEKKGNYYILKEGEVVEQ